MIVSNSTLLTETKLIRIIFCQVILAMFIGLSSLFIGGENIDPLIILSNLFNPNPENYTSWILLYLRVPRIILAFIVGGALAMVGAVFQVIFRNPLATPYTLGIASGGALGAVSVLVLNDFLFHWGPFSTQQFASLLGSSLIALVIYMIASQQRSLSMPTLLLAGVTMGILCNAGIICMRYLATPHGLYAIEHWLIGGIQVNGFREIATMAPLLISGLGLLLWQIPNLNQIAMGDELAAGYGVDVTRTQKLVFIGGSMVTSAVVAIVGPIGFVGLIVPHMVKRLSGVDQRIVVPISFLAGGTFLILCDTMARSLFYPTELPVGIITAIAGGPFFLHLLLRKNL